jgi:hypothetical protein
MTTLELLKSKFTDAENPCISFSIRRNQKDYIVRILQDTPDLEAEIESSLSGQIQKVHCRAEETVDDLLHEVSTRLNTI